MTGAEATGRGRVLPVAPALLAGVVFACDALLPVVKPDLVLTAMLDEPAHLATAALILIGFTRPCRWRLPVGGIVLAASVLIDLDHIPLYLGLESIAPGGRPVTHSLLTPLALATVAACIPGRARRAVGAVGLGVCLHLVRDLATGPGVSLWWPLDPRSLLLPYPWYAGAVGLLGIAGVIRLSNRGGAWVRRP